MGVFGSGIAVVFRKKFPEMTASYTKHCKDGTLQPGMVYPWQLPNGKYVYNLASQRDVSRTVPQAKAEWITQAVRSMVAHAEERGIADIGLPLIGGGLGGLTEDAALAAIEAGCADSPVSVTVYLL